jgi:hypothetical protein
MLERLLDLLRTEQAFNRADLARRLEVSDVLLDKMLVELQRMGYLEMVPGCQAAACPHCPQVAVCAPEGAAKLWKLRSHRFGSASNQK